MAMAFDGCSRVKYLKSGETVDGMRDVIVMILCILCGSV